MQITENLMNLNVLNGLKKNTLCLCVLVAKKQKLKYYNVFVTLIFFH